MDKSHFLSELFIFQDFSSSIGLSFYSQNCFKELDISFIYPYCSLYVKQIFSVSHFPSSSFSDCMIQLPRSFSQLKCLSCMSLKQARTFQSLICWQRSRLLNMRSTRTVFLMSQSQLTLAISLLFSFQQFQTDAYCYFYRFFSTQLYSLISTGCRQNSASPIFLLDITFRLLFITKLLLSGIAISSTILKVMRSSRLLMSWLPVHLQQPSREFWTSCRVFYTKLSTLILYKFFQSQSQDFFRTMSEASRQMGQSAKRTGEERFLASRYYNMCWKGLSSLHMNLKGKFWQIWPSLRKTLFLLNSYLQTQRKPCPSKIQTVSLSSSSKDWLFRISRGNYPALFRLEEKHTLFPNFSTTISSSRSGPALGNQISRADSRLRRKADWEGPKRPGVRVQSLCLSLFLKS